MTAGPARLRGGRPERVPGQSSRGGFPTERSLPAEPFAHEVFLVLAQGRIDLASFASSLGVDSRWLHQVLAGEITQLPLLTVVGLCKAMRVMPEDVWPPEAAARAFAGWPVNTFDVDDH